MDLFSSMGSLANSAGGTILPFLFVLFLVVFVHEMGHFLVGRWCGIKVVAFSIGFGPEIVGWTDGKGTRWRLALIPLGGYVKFFGDSSAASTPDGELVGRMSASERSVSFFYQPVWKRAAVVAAGPLANFILAIAIFAAIAMAYGRPSPAPRVGAVVAGSAAERADFRPGDLIVSIDRQPVESFEQLTHIIAASPGKPLQVLVEREGRDVTLNAVPDLVKDEKPGQTGPGIGRLGLQSSTEPVGFGQAVTSGAQQTWTIVEMTGSYVKGLFAGRESTNQLSGPIRIAQVSGQVAKVGIVALVNLAAILSVSIGLINLVPVPLLDGGHLLFYLFEALRGRPLSERTQEFGFRIGLALVVMLMLFTTVNDLLHLDALTMR